MAVTMSSTLNTDPATDGSNLSVWLTEPQCPLSTFLTNYTVTNGSGSGTPESDHAEITTSIFRAVAPQTRILCRSGTTLPTAGDISFYVSPPIRLVSVSAGFYPPTQTPQPQLTADYTATDQTWDDFVYDKMIPVVKSAGNSSTKNMNNIVSPPGFGLNLLTVGNYDDATMTIAGTSSWVNSTHTKSEKPELSAPGENIGAGGHPPAGGTSFATPHVAGIVADMTESLWWLTLQPHMTKAVALVGSIDGVAGGVDHVGLGGLDAMAARWNHYPFGWSGTYSDWNSWIVNDGGTDNGALEVSINLTAGQYAAFALTWMTKGSYTFSHRTAGLPIGSDYDLWVYKPNGSIQASSAGAYAASDFVSFWPTVTGTYTVKITRFSANDTTSDSRVALVYKW
jgi:hypothetical protein